MRFLADECCDTELVSILRKEGHDIIHVSEETTGIPDEKILNDAYNDNRILITEDKDFGELVYRLKKPCKGIILIRIDVKDRNQKKSRLKQLLDKYPERLAGYFTVIDVKKYRFRPLIFPLSD